MIVSRGPGPDLPRKNQHLVVYWAQPRVAARVDWLGAPDEFSGTLKVQSNGTVHVVSNAGGYRREKREWKHWSAPDGTLDVFADDVLWAKTRRGEILCSRNAANRSGFTHCNGLGVDR